MMRCSNCDALIKEGAKFCGKCGAKTPQQAINCKVCGKVIPGDDQFCPHCGMDRRLVENNYNGNQPVPPPAPAYAPINTTPQPMYAPPATLMCGRCGMGVPVGMARCPYCSHKLKNTRVKDYGGIAGGAILLAALINVTLFGLASMGAFLDFEQFGWFSLIFFIIFIMNIFAFYGAICAIRRKRYLVAMIGAIITILSLTFILGIVAVVLLIISKEAFLDDGKDPNVAPLQKGRYL